MKRKLRDNGLGIAFGLLFLGALIGQAVAGHADYNNQQIADGAQTVSLFQYVTSSSFVADVAENWQSEYLQFFLYIFATIWLVQRGSPESKLPAETGPESDEKQRVGRHASADSPGWARAVGWRLWMFSNSLCLAMGAIFLLSWLAQSVAGVVTYNADQLANHEDTVTWFEYLGSADFWNRTLQNWQSEFLAVGSMVVLSIYLRQRGSPESKTVGTPHAKTDGQD
ncbi:DUF6766 family protein [Actinophytocola sp.]|uniref:DUF6766 family protein n=1 Tax=Actinophytocola sp. TaxID=1872138 RepID=UPI0038998CA6